MQQIQSPLPRHEVNTVTCRLVVSQLVTVVTAGTHHLTIGFAILPRCCHAVLTLANVWQAPTVVPIDFPTGFASGHGTF